MLREDIKEFLSSIPSEVNVVAATKYVNSDEMRKLYDAGVHDFGENRVEAFLQKYEELKDLDVTWHLIGHLQRNKAKKVINKIDYLHSLDSLELAKIIDKNAEKPLKCFIEVSINHEENKDGVPYEDIIPFIKEILTYKNIELVGFMMMAIKNDTDDNIKEQFTKLNVLKKQCEEELDIKIPYLSMGMSNDYLDAIEAGATHVRLGRILWKM